MQLPHLLAVSLFGIDADHVEKVEAGAALLLESRLLFVLTPVSALGKGQQESLEAIIVILLHVLPATLVKLKVSS